MSRPHRAVALLIAVLATSVVATSVLAVRDVPVALATDDSGEGPVTRYFFTLKLRVDIGAVKPLITPGEYGIQGGAPDGHVSAESYGGVTRTFFPCWDGMNQLSCLSENTSTDAFSSLAGLFRDPTGTRFQTVMDGPIAGDPYESQYASVNATWRDPATGTIHGWYHAEVPVPGCSPGVHYASIGYATSIDDGHSFVKQGMVVTSADPVVPNQCFGQGVGLPHVIASGTYLYMFYDTLTPPDFVGGGITIARATQANPAQWFKYYNGSFSEPGLGGLRTILIAMGSGGQQSWGASVIWSSTLGKFIMVHTDYNHEGTIYLRTSTNLLTWSESKALFGPSSLYRYRYPTLVGATDDRMGSTAWLYFGRHPADGYVGVDTLLARRSVTLGAIKGQKY
jgi:hypothetical protein